MGGRQTTMGCFPHGKCGGKLGNGSSSGPVGSKSSASGVSADIESFALWQSLNPLCCYLSAFLRQKCAGLEAVINLDLDSNPAVRHQALALNPPKKKMTRQINKISPKPPPPTMGPPK